MGRGSGWASRVSGCKRVGGVWRGRWQGQEGTMLCKFRLSCGNTCRYDRPGSMARQPPLTSGQNDHVVLAIVLLPAPRAIGAAGRGRVGNLLATLQIAGEN